MVYCLVSQTCSSRFATLRWRQRTSLCSPKQAGLTEPQLHHLECRPASIVGQDIACIAINRRRSSPSSWKIAQPNISDAVREPSCCLACFRCSACNFPWVASLASPRPRPPTFRESPIPVAKQGAATRGPTRSLPGTAFPCVHGASLDTRLAQHGCHRKTCFAESAPALGCALHHPDCRTSFAVSGPRGWLWKLTSVAACTR